jgi:hypothetical protein
MSLESAVEGAAVKAVASTGVGMYGVLAAFLVGLAGGAAGAWWVQQQRLDAQVGQLTAAHAQAMQAVANEAATAASAAEARQTELQQQVAAVDAQHSKEMQDAQAQNDQLRAAVAAGSRRLSVAARCPAAAGRSGVPAGAAPAGVGDGSAAQRVDLDPATAGRLLAIAAAGDKAIRQLSACQAYVKVIIGGK